MTAAPTPTRRRWTRTYLPTQHGAWAMLLVPFVLGSAASSFGWWSLPLLTAWLSAYLVSYYAFQGLKARRWVRYRAPLQLYGAVLVVSAVALVVYRPWVVATAALFVPFTAVNAWYARHRWDRYWLNGVVSVTQACLMVLVAYALGLGLRLADLEGGSVDWSTPAQLYAAAWLYFTGTVFFVKTMIREAGDSSYYRASVGFHVAALLLAGLLDVWLMAPFALYLLRAVTLPHRSLRPAQVGVVEIVNSMLLVVVSLVVV